MISLDSGRSTISKWPKNSRNKQSATSPSPLRRSRNLRRNGLRSHRWLPLRRGVARLVRIRSKVINLNWPRTRPCPDFHTQQITKLTKRSNSLSTSCQLRNQGRLLCLRANVAARSHLHPHRNWPKAYRLRRNLECPRSQSCCLRLR